MRVAVVGKGGAGKSVLAGTLARCLARSGRRVLVVDSDPLPGLAQSLGVETGEVGLPPEAVEETEGPDGRFRHHARSDLTPDEVVERYAIEGPDGVRVLFHGKMRGTNRPDWGSQAAVRQLAADLADDASSSWSIVGDLPGGTRQAFFGWGGYADRYLVVVEPTASGILSARRLTRLAVGPGTRAVAVVVNKAVEPGDADRVAEATRLEVIATLPRDHGVEEAERVGKSVIDVAPHSLFVTAVASLAERLDREGG